MPGKLVLEKRYKGDKLYKETGTNSYFLEFTDGEVSSFSGKPDDSEVKSTIRRHITDGRWSKRYGKN